MTEFPELQQALVHAAGRRRRSPRRARPLIVAVACAAIAAVVVLTIARESSDERTASPPPPPTASYSLFQRPATRADELPAAVSGMPGLRVDDARLAQRIKASRLYLVTGTLDQRDVLCAFLVVNDRARFGCDPAGTVRGYGFPPGDGEAGAIVATVPDGIDAVDFAFGSERFGAAVSGNAVLLLPEPWPTGRGTASWDGGEAPLKAP
jgi:hypothetical protein